MIRALWTAAFVAPIVLCASPIKATAGANTPIGAVIEDGQLASLGSGGQANVLVFFKPDQRNMAASLNALAGCEKELQGKPVRWLAIVPARYSAEDAKSFAQAVGFAMPVVVDVGDQLHQKIGIAMHPSVAILDRAHRLAQFQPFTKLNFCEAVMARIRRVLGELDDAGLAQALDPSAAAPAPGDSAAKRDVKLAEMLFAGGNLDKALEFARKGVGKDPRNASAQALVGRIFAARGDCAAARTAFDAALKLDPNEAQAKAGRAACAGK